MSCERSEKNKAKNIDYPGNVSLVNHENGCESSDTAEQLRHYRAAAAVGPSARLSVVGKHASEVKGALSNRRGRGGHTILVTKERPQCYRVLSVLLCVLPFL